MRAVTSNEFTESGPLPANDGPPSAGRVPTEREDRPTAMLDRAKEVIGRVPRSVWGAAIAATALAGAAAFNNARAKAAERANPPEGSFLEIDGVRLHYVDRGAGRPVVLLHGNGAMIQDLEASGLLGGLAEEYRVIAFDRPGFGHSTRPRTTVWTPQAQAELVEKALHALGIERPIVVGHSWGAMVALALAIAHPGTASALVLLSGYYYPTVRPDLLNTLPAVPVIGDVMCYTVSPILGRLIFPAVKTHTFWPARVPDSFDGYPEEIALRPSQIRATAAETALMMPAAAALSPYYGELELPVVIVAGEGDKLAFLDRHAERLHAELAGSELRILPGGGHMIHYIATEGVLEAIESAAEMADQDI